MDNLSRGIKSAAALALIFQDQIFKHLAQHFRVNGHFPVKRFIFAHGEIIEIKHLKDFGENPVIQQNIGIDPIIALEGFK